MKTLVITGANRGIGLATANKFLAEGWRVIGTSTSGESKIQDPNFTIVRLDLTSDEQIKESVDKIKKVTKEIDVLINNAGVLLDDGEEKIDVKKLAERLEKLKIKQGEAVMTWVFPFKQSLSPLNG